MITVQEYVKERQPAVYGQMAQVWRVVELRADVEFTPVQRMLDKIMRYKPRPGRIE